MLILRAYKTEIDPNNVQKTLLAKHAGAARFTWNWALSRRVEEYKLTGKSSNAIEQHRQLNSLKPADFPWMYEVSKCAPQEALRDLDKAFRNFFAKRAKLRSTKIADSSHQPSNVVAQDADGAVAGLAEQATNLASFVVVIDGQRLRCPATQGAFAVLELSEFLELFNRQTVLLSKPIDAPTSLSFFKRQRLPVQSHLLLDGFAVLLVGRVPVSPLPGGTLPLTFDLVGVTALPVLLSRIVTGGAPMLQPVRRCSAFLKFGDWLCLSAVLAGFGIHTIIVLACQQQSECLEEKNYGRTTRRKHRGDAAGKPSGEGRFNSDLAAFLQVRLGCENGQSVHGPILGSSLSLHGRGQQHGGL